ncbi:MerR family DNA-binding transcriptional regulator [Nonomuraea sp. NPDC049269]|uniref:MerR family DNA-binding transcriptional regulator n=1 Tax=Nonomuraea sp. NPDC049269 TaxID=3364349 RepID=UPI0037156ECC
MYRISQDDLRRLLDIGAVTLADALPEPRYAAEHLPGTVNNPVSPPLIWRPDWLRTRPGPSSRTAPGRRAPGPRWLPPSSPRLGYPDVRVYEGGKTDWAQAGLTVRRQPDHPAGGPMSAPEQAGLRTGEVAEQAGVNIQTLRYYERRGLLTEPHRSEAARRLVQTGGCDRLYIAGVFVRWWRAWRARFGGDRDAPRLAVAGLLRPETAVVQFFGRSRELRELERWCDDADTAVVRLVVAPAGFGKSPVGR